MPPRRKRRDPNLPLRAVGLIRVSKVGGRGDDLLSPDLQRTSITEYADRRGMEVTRWVEALDESGSQSRSPWWARLDEAVGWVEDGQVDAILVWRYSRAARHRRRWAVALDRVEVAGGLLESASEQLDTTTSTGRLGRGMLAELAAWEAEVKGEQWQEVHKNRRSRGLPHTSHPQLGYTVSRATGYVVDEEAAVWVRAAYERFVQGDTFRQITHWLNRSGHRTTRGGEWAPSNVARWMDHGFPAGWLWSETYGLTRGAHDPIVDGDLWAAYLRKREGTRGRAPRERAAVHPLAGLVRCGRCTGTMQRAGTTTGAGEKVRVFRCRTNVNGGDCPGVQVNEQVVHEAVKAWLDDVASGVDAQANALAEQKVKVATARKDARRLLREVEALDKALANLAVAKAKGEVRGRAFELARGDLQRQRDNAALEMWRAEEDRAAASRPAPRVARSLLGSWDVLRLSDPQGLRDVLAALVGRVEVHPAELGKRRSRVEVVPRWEVRS